MTVWFDAIKEVIGQNKAALKGKVVVDPSNAIKPKDNNPNEFEKTLPEDVPAGSEIAKLLPNSHYVKAFGSLSADSLKASGFQDPRVALFYATDDAKAEAEIQRLITAAGFAPVKAGGVDRAGDIEVFGRLHQMDGLQDKTLTAEEAKAAAAEGDEA